MDLVLLVKAALMGIVEGLTEFLPVSSTGHLILAGALLGLSDEKSKVFDIAIQTGAILAVVIVFWQRISTSLRDLGSSARARRFVGNVAIGFLPAAVIGFFVYRYIKAYLFNGPVVAAAFIVGGLIILWVEKRAKLVARIADVDQMTPLDALKVGFVQCLGMIPGTSRSGSTIIGGMLLGLSRKAATDFSFFLAIPTLIAAGGYSLWKERALLSAADLPMFAVGFIVSLPGRLDLRALAAALRVDPRRSRPFRLVPHRVRHRRAGHVDDGHGALGRLRPGRRRVGRRGASSVHRFVNTRSHTPWPSAACRGFSNFVSGRLSRGAARKPSAVFVSAGSAREHLPASARRTAASRWRSAGIPPGADRLARRGGARIRRLDRVGACCASSCATGRERRG